MTKTKFTLEEITILVEANVGWIQFDYNGGGDSGAIEDIKFIKNTCQVMSQAWEEDNIGDIPKLEEISDPLDVNGLEQIAYAHLNNIEDWRNNDGGYGNMFIKIPSMEFKNNVNIYYTKEEAYRHEGKLDIDAIGD